MKTMCYVCFKEEKYYQYITKILIMFLNIYAYIYAVSAKEIGRFKNVF